MAEKYFEWGIVGLCVAGIAVLLGVGALAVVDLSTRNDDPATMSAPIAAPQADARLVVGLSEVIANQQQQIRDLQRELKLIWSIIQDAAPCPPKVNPSGPQIRPSVAEVGR